MATSSSAPAPPPGAGLKLFDLMNPAAITSSFVELQMDPADKSVYKFDANVSDPFIPIHNPYQTNLIPPATSGSSY
eukprot:NODE_1840_length_484_cov_524.395402_g1762_i0.p1 GENE.NODE_1840_length_484_cov_524.395402_g1762_i0~~NODE_1840_length_484_cov_524.395402_g1762_i0.p1  ORF type:complete len:76 (+),score=24.40 NODE_1840_length_484_cov_524.395402_g1762_i0:52-279(+)